MRKICVKNFIRVHSINPSHKASRNYCSQYAVISSDLRLIVDLRIYAVKGADTMSAVAYVCPSATTTSNGSAERSFQSYTDNRARVVQSALESAGYVFSSQTSSIDDLLDAICDYHKIDAYEIFKFEE